MIKKNDIQGYSEKVFLTILMNKYIQRLLLPFGHDLKPDRWIFVIGCYNSATTLLSDILRAHPDIGGLPNEGAFLTDVLPYPELYGWPRMWSQCHNKVRMGVGLKGESRARRIKQHWSLWFPKAAPNLVEKSISNATRLLFLQEYFQPAYFIYIVRNGYVVSKGIQKKANYKRWGSSYKNNGYPIELCAEQWQMSDTVVEKDSYKLKKILNLTYEELTEKPHDTVLKITEFLGVQPIPEKVFHNKWSVHESVSSIINMNHIGFSRLSSTDFKKIEETAGDVLKKYGYTRDFNSSL